MTGCKTFRSRERQSNLKDGVAAVKLAVPGVRLSVVSPVAEGRRDYLYLAPQSLDSLSNHRRKNSIYVRPKSHAYLRGLVPLEGGYRDHHERGAGCGGRERCCWREHRSCGRRSPDTSALASSSWEASFLQADGDKKSRSPERVRRKP